MYDAFRASIMLKHDFMLSLFPHTHDVIDVCYRFLIFIRSVLVYHMCGMLHYVASRCMFLPLNLPTLVSLLLFYYYFKLFPLYI